MMPSRPERGVLLAFSGALVLTATAAVYTWHVAGGTSHALGPAEQRFVLACGLGAVMLSAGALTALVFGMRREAKARAQADRNARQAGQILDSIVENIPDMIFVKDAETLSFVRINRAAEMLLERDRRDVVGRTGRDIRPHHIADFVNAQDRQVLESGVMLDVPEERLQTATRGERLLHTRKIPILDEAGRPRYLLGISEDVTERARGAAEIRALSEALERRALDVEAVNRELETFAYSVSHDLRAPLRHISGYVQLLTQSLEGKLEDDSRRYLGVVSQASVQMGQLIDDLLAFSRIARIDLTRASVSPREIVEAVIAGLDVETRGRDVEWRIGELPRVDVDPALLKVVYANLIGNAVKYSAPRTRALIEIGADADDGGRAVLYVRDNGVGFDMAYADRLFGIFQRLHAADDFDGTGIGLATVQRIIARHGGRVWAQAAPGEGATFRFTLAKPA